MPHVVAPTNRGRTARFVSAIALVGAILLPVLASATPPTPLNVLFVANGYYTQENDIENHFLDLGYTVTLVRSSIEDSVIVLLSNHLQIPSPNVLARTAGLSMPWLLSSSASTNTDGYGPYIIDRYTQHDGLTGNIGLYHTVSVWHGGLFTPYGVYTGYEEITWP